MVLSLAHHSDATGPSVQRVPNLQLHTFPVLTPLVIPEAQDLDSFQSKALLTFLIPFELLRHAMLKPIEFHCKASGRAVEIKKIIILRMLPAKLEPSKSAGSQSPPQFPFGFCLRSAQASSVACWVHPGINRMLRLQTEKVQTNPSP